MISLSIFFAIVASILSVVAYLAYAYQIHKGFSNPNPATIFIWFGEGVINTFTYFEAVQDWWQTLITITNAFLIFVIFFYSLFRKKFPKIEPVEILIIFAAISVGIFWAINGNPRSSQGLLQFVYVLSYIPVGISVIKRTKKESAVAWNFAMVSYVFATMAVISNYTGEILSLAYPVINGILGNGIIVFLIYKFKKAD